MSEKDNNENEDGQKLQSEKNTQVENGLAQNPASATSASGSSTQNKKLKMVLAGIIIFLVGIALVYFFFIKYSVPTVKQNDIKQINLGEYFPTDTSSHLTYYMYGDAKTFLLVQDQTVKHQTDGKYLITEQVSSPPNTPIDQRLTPYENTRLYELSPNSIKCVERFGGILNNHSTDTLIILSDKPWQNQKGDTDKITGLNKQIIIPAGTFDNCIEATQTISVLSSPVTVVSYFAPKIGLILEKKKIGKMDFFVSQQLVEYSSSSMGSSSTNKPSSTLESNSETISDKDSSSDNNLNAINYTNSTYGFNLEIPGWWKGKYSVREDDLNGNKNIIFSLTPKDKEFDVFSIELLEGRVDVKQGGRYYSVFGFNGKYTYIMEYYEDQLLLLPQNKQELEIYNKMADGFGTISKSFKFASTDPPNLSSNTKVEQNGGTVQDGAVNYKHFSKHDHEWSYSVDYPENFEQLPPDAHGGGQSFQSPDKKTTISTQVTIGDRNLTPQEVYEFELEGDRVLKRGRTVISKSFGDQWVEIISTDTEGNIIFLRGLNNQNVTTYFQIKYPSDQLKTYEPIQRHIADSLKKIN